MINKEYDEDPEISKEALDNAYKQADIEEIMEKVEETLPPEERVRLEIERKINDEKEKVTSRRIKQYPVLENKLFGEQSYLDASKEDKEARIRRIILRIIGYGIIIPGILVSSMIYSARSYVNAIGFDKACEKQNITLMKNERDRLENTNGLIKYLAGYNSIDKGVERTALEGIVFNEILNLSFVDNTNIEKISEVKDYIETYLPDNKSLVKEITKLYENVRKKQSLISKELNQE